MAMDKEQFDENLDLKVSDRLKSDLKTIFKSEQKVPLEIDRAILDKASQKLVSPRNHFYILRWAGPVAAAAAILICTYVFVNQKAPVAKLQTSVKSNIDIDSSGRVDILDAFKLAKQIQTENTVDIKWDINGDGRVDDDDVQIIAYAAVSLNKGV